MRPKNPRKNLGKVNTTNLYQNDLNRSLESNTNKSAKKSFISDSGQKINQSRQGVNSRKSLDSEKAEIEDEEEKLREDIGTMIDSQGITPHYRCGGVICGDDNHRPQIKDLDVSHRYESHYF